MTIVEIAHEVIIATVKSYGPHAQVDLTCANTCCSEANISLSTTCDLDYVGKKDKDLWAMLNLLKITVGTW